MPRGREAQACRGDADLLDLHSGRQLGDADGEVHQAAEEVGRQAVRFDDLYVDLAVTHLGDLEHDVTADDVEVDVSLDPVRAVGGQCDAARNAARVGQRREGDQRRGAEVIDLGAVARLDVHPVQRGRQALDLELPARPRGLVAGVDINLFEIARRQLGQEREALDGHVRLARQSQRSGELAGHLVLGERVGGRVAADQQHDDHDQGDPRPPPAPPPGPWRGRRLVTLSPWEAGAGRMVLCPAGVLEPLSGLVPLISRPRSLVSRPGSVLLVSRPGSLVSRPGSEALPSQALPSGTLPGRKGLPRRISLARREPLVGPGVLAGGEARRGRESLTARVPLIRRTARAARVPLIGSAALTAGIPLVRRGSLAARVPLICRGLPVSHVSLVRRRPLAGRVPLVRRAPALHRVLPRRLGILVALARRIALRRLRLLVVLASRIQLRRLRVLVTLTVRTAALDRVLPCRLGVLVFWFLLGFGGPLPPVASIRAHATPPAVPVMMTIPPPRLPTIIIPPLRCYLVPGITFSHLLRSARVRRGVSSGRVQARCQTFQYQGLRLQYVKTRGQPEWFS